MNLGSSFLHLKYNTVKLGDNESLYKEQLGVKEPITDY